MGYQANVLITWSINKEPLQSHYECKPSQVYYQVDMTIDVSRTENNKQTIGQIQQNTNKS